MKSIDIFEEELRDPVKELFRNKNYDIYDEIRLFSRNIDLIAKRKSNLIAVELKLVDWKKAIHQASLDFRVANFSYIALPESIISRVNRKMYHDLLNTGIGLISVDGNAKIMMKSERSKKIQPVLRKKFLKKLRDVDIHGF